MKYFTLFASLAIGTTTAGNTDAVKAVDICSMAATLGQKTAEEYIQQEIATANQGNVDDYYVRYKPINEGQSTFVTISCKYAPWQHNDHPLSPYKDGRHWNRTKAKDTYNQYKDDREALKLWFLANGGTEQWPGKAGGRYRCGNRDVNGAMITAWRKLKDIPKCPEHNKVGATVDFVDPAGKCYIDTIDRDVGSIEIWMPTTNVADYSEYCKNKCKENNYVYAAVQVGRWCGCGNSFGKYGLATQSDCDFKCNTNDMPANNKPCGSNWRNNIFLSGLKP
jgi:hypothetical protein